MVAVYLTENQSVFTIQSADLSHIIGCDLDDTKTPLFRCIPFISKVKSGDITSKGQYMNYQSFIKSQFKKLLKNSFHSINIELRDSTGEKIPFVSVGITRMVLLFRKISKNLFCFKIHTKWLLKSQQISVFVEDMQGNVEEVFELLDKLMGELQSPLLKNL